MKDAKRQAESSRPAERDVAAKRQCFHWAPPMGSADTRLDGLMVHFESLISALVVVVSVSALFQSLVNLREAFALETEVQFTFDCRRWAV